MAVVANSIGETIGETIGDLGLESKRVDEIARRSRYLKVWDVGVLLAALLVFLLFLTLLIRVVFPQGSRLSDMTTDRDSTLFEDDARGLVDVAGGGITDLGSFFALLGDVRRNVKIRSADSIAWSNASRGATVGNRDAVQTFTNSRARVDFKTDNELRIGQNSLVVFRSGAADPFLQRRNPAVVMLHGELSGTVNANYGSLGVEFPAGLVELSSGAQSDAAVNFRIGTNPDESSTITVYSGQADVSIAGEHFQIAANYGLTIAKDGRTAGVAALPSLPSIYVPSANAIAKYLAAPPRVTFRWSEVSAAQNYRLEIAKDKEFSEVVVDDYVDETSLTHGNLAPGDYYWRISARSGWLEGPASLPRHLRIVRDAEPPPLQLQPIELVESGSYRLRGNTARNAKVLVLGHAVKTGADGRFEYLFNPKPGTQTIVVESIDSVGNVAYRSQVLHVPGASGRSD